MKNLALKTTTSLWLKSNKFDLGKNWRKIQPIFALFFARFYRCKCSSNEDHGVQIGFGQDLEKKSRNMRWVKNEEETTPKLWDDSAFEIIDWRNRYSAVWQFDYEQHIIRLTISNGFMEREDSQDRYYVKTSRKKCIVEVDMSYTQFAEAITSLNMGDGVPVTITNIGG